jgi:Cytochrome P460
MKKVFTIMVVASFAMVAFTTIRQSTSAASEVPYPEGFREWTHIKTSLSGFGNIPQAKFDGYHHIYANDKALQGYKTGIYPEGSVIVFDKHEVDTTGGAIETGKRKFINVMHKNTSMFKETGGWGYEEFTADSKTEGRLSVEKQLSCYNSCHKAEKKTDYVFTKMVK